jgi:phage terminase large subunit-like protein
MLLPNRSSYVDLFQHLHAHAETPEQVDSALRQLCLDDLYYLLRYELGREDFENDFLFDRCREVQQNPDDHLDLWAREFYKSTIITYGLTIQNILNNPNITVGIFSHTRPIAKAFLRQIKREFESNDRLKAHFSDILWDNPSQEAPKWSEDDGLIVKRSQNSKESTVEAHGVVDGQPTGKHFSLLVYDDIVTLQSVGSPEMIEKTNDALSVSFNLGADGGKRRFIGTRYHYNDTYRMILERDIANPRVYAAEDEDGNPVFLPAEKLAKKRKDMGPYVYSCQMLQAPVGDASQGFKREWLRFFDGNPPPDCNWYILVDPANGKRKLNDYTSMWAVGLGVDTNYYCIPEVRDKLNLTERAKRLMDLHRKYSPKEVRYESYGIQADIDYIKLVQEREHYRFDIIAVGGSMQKTDRIKRLIPLFEDSKVYLPIKYNVADHQGISRDLVKDFVEDEYMAFPVPIHDDMLDGLSRIADVEGKYTYQDSKQVISLNWPKPAMAHRPRKESRDWRL